MRRCCRSWRCPAAWPRSWPRSRSRTPLKDFIGTGPYKFKERRPDQYVLLTRFDQYASRKEPAERLRRQARGRDRRTALRAGAQRQHPRRRLRWPASTTSPTCCRWKPWPRLEKSGGKTVPDPHAVLRLSLPSCSTPRKAMAAARPCARRSRPRWARARCWPPASATRVSSRPRPTTSPRARPSIRPAGGDLYNQRNAPKAKGRGQGRLQGRADPHADQPPVRLPLQHGAAHGRAAQARRLQGRTQRGRLGDAGAAPQRLEAVGHLRHPFGPVPRAHAVAAATGRRRAGLVVVAGQAGRAGRAATSETDPAKRGALWGKVQQVVYDEVPYINVGKFNSLSAERRPWRATQPSTWPFFWNSARTQAAAELSEDEDSHAQYLLPRVMGMLVVMAIVAVLVFILTRAASGDPIAVLLGDQATAEDIARAQKVYGLDKPLPVQFGYWLQRAVAGQPGPVDLPAAPGDPGAVGARRAHHAAGADGGGASRR